jgi:serine phosphatase RsbU (regulator of sigma subunit)/anti-sigma regulatory factor (Ser/Thr protein kinase)
MAVKRSSEQRAGPIAKEEHAFDSLRAVMGRMADVVWQADAAGRVTGITLCRPASRQGDGNLDETEVQQIEELWRKCVRCAEAFRAIYHVRSAGSSSPRSFLVQAVPVLDTRDEVLYWSGSATELDQFADASTRFISEAASVLSSSLNRGTIVNRLVQVSIDSFCDLCAVHAFDDAGTIRLEGIAHRRPAGGVPLETLTNVAATAVRNRQSLLMLSGAFSGPVEENVAVEFESAKIRSMIVAPLFVGSTCIGALSFLESERSSSFAARDVDVAVVAARLLAMALENIKTFEREQRLTERFRFLARITEGLFTTLDSAKTLERLIASLAGSFADYAIAASLGDLRLNVVAVAGTNASAFRDDAEREMIVSLRERRSILIGAASHVRHAASLKAGPVFETARPQSWMMVPLFLGDKVYGTVVCCSNHRRYDGADLELLQEVGRRASFALEHAESFARERRLTHTLQQATLPTQLATIEGASLSAIYRPAASEVQVGGDWYDAFELDEGRVLLTVGDVTGHGLEASIVMGKLRHAINVVAMYERNPARILDAAERVLLRRYPNAIATAFVAILDPRRGTMAYANAGHPYPLVRHRAGALEELAAEGLPIGLRYAGGEACAVTHKLDGTALLAFYTDGLTEVTRDMLAGEKRVREALSTSAVLYVHSPAQFLEKYCLDAQAPADDVAILVLNFVQCRRWRFEAGDWRAARVARREFIEVLEASASPESDFKAIELIFGELVANVAQHAAGPLEVAFEWRDRDAVLHLIDRGDGDVPTDRPKADLMTEHGRGLWLVQRLGAQLDVEILPGVGAHVQAILPIRGRTA